MTVEEFEEATEQDLRNRANQLFEEASNAGKLVRTALLTEARFYLDEIDRRDDRFRSRRDFWMEFAIIVLIVVEIALSVVGLRGARDEFQVLDSLEASSSATAATLTALQQTTEQLKSAAQEQVALEYVVALKIYVDAANGRLEITNEGRTLVTFWGMKIAARSAEMQAAPSILVPGAPHSVPAEQILAIATEQMNKNHVASISLILFLKNERSEDYLARYDLVSGSPFQPFAMHAQFTSLSRVPWSQKKK